MADKLSNDDSNQNTSPSAGGKGFGGFSDLVSDVSKDIESAARESTSQPTYQPEATTSSTSGSQHTTAQTESPRVNKLPVSPLPPSGSSSAKWFWGIGIVLVVLIGIGNSGKEKNPSHSPSPAYSSTSKSATGLNMALPWREVVKKPEYQALSDADKAAAREEYFDSVVTPQLNPNDVADAYLEFTAFDRSLVPPVLNLDPIGHAPNGQPWPTKSGYLVGYKKLNTDGLSSLTIDNTSNDSNVYLKLFALNQSPPDAVRHVFIKAGEKFTFSSVRAGNYDVRYRDLRNGGISKSEGFELQEIHEDGGTRYSEMTMTLYKIQNGNMQMRDISEAEF
ncbi:MAG: hypothetical protein ABL860_10160 [Candidatus Nitrotoga sp.]